MYINESNDCSEDIEESVMTEDFFEDFTDYEEMEDYEEPEDEAMKDDMETLLAVDEIEDKAHKTRNLSAEDFPLNLLDEVFGDGQFKKMCEARYMPETGPKDLTPTVMYLLTQRFGIRTMEIIYYRFIRGENLEEIGKHYNLTRERVHQLLYKPITHLFHNREILVYGLAEYTKRQQNEKIAEAKDLMYQNLRSQLDELEEKVIRNIGACKLQTNRKMMRPTGEETKEEKLERIYAIPIEELGLSVRPFNALKRCGRCDTVGEIIEFAGEDGTELYKVRNLGRRSSREIEGKLLELGCDIHWS